MPQVDNETNSTMCYCPECFAATRMSYHLPEDCKTIQKLKQQLERSRGETDRLEGKYDVVQQQLAEARELIKEAITIIRDKTISDTKGVLRIHAAIDAASKEGKDEN